MSDDESEHESPRPSELFTEIAETSARVADWTTDPDTERYARELAADMAEIAEEVDDAGESSGTERPRDMCEEPSDRLDHRQEVKRHE